MDNLDDLATPSNVPEFSVSELSFALKREIETAFATSFWVIPRTSRVRRTWLAGIDVF